MGLRVRLESRVREALDATRSGLSAAPLGRSDSEEDEKERGENGDRAAHLEASGTGTNAVPPCIGSRSPDADPSN